MLRHNFAGTGYAALIISQYPLMLLGVGAAVFSVVGRGFVCYYWWEKGDVHKGCAGGDVEERGK